ncbi:MAG TPA: ice-binding family protein [Solirubrobacterales bacterium]|nr:ice-binding family protein [Solirubrobacterales bacterium]
MSSLIRPKRGIAGIILAVAFALFAVPAAVAAPVDLGTASPFVVLGGTTVTNTGPSVLNGDLGVAPGTALTGFGLPAVVNGATHENTAVAAQAQSDLTNAYDVAAGQEVLPANDLSGTDLGNRKLSPGAYQFSSSALLTGALTLDAEGDPNAQFVFLIGSELTTESASSVVLINEASPCNVFWQVGSSANIGTTTAFQGTLMALTSISLKDSATVVGRMLARNGQVSLINNVLTAPECEVTPPGREVPPGSGTPGSEGPGPVTPGGETATVAAGSPAGSGQGNPGRGTDAGRPASNGRAVVRPNRRQACTEGFRASVTGHMIKRVVFSLDGKVIGARNGSPFAMSMRAAPGQHQVRVRVTFKDATHAKTMTLAYRACAAAPLRPHRAPSTFTG